MILKLVVGQTVSCEKEGKWLKARCLKIDCSLVKVLFENEGMTEWIYRGSTRWVCKGNERRLNQVGGG